MKHSLILATALVHVPLAAIGQDTKTIKKDASPPTQQAAAPITDTSLTPFHSASTADLNDIMLRQIDLETKRLDRLFQNAETLGKVMTALLVAFVAILSVFGYRSVKELKEDMHSSVEVLVAKSLRENSNIGKSFEELVARLGPAEDRWRTIEMILNDLEKFATVTGSLNTDAQGAFRMAKDLSEKDDISTDERKIALGYILTIIDLGVRGTVDPNLLYNASSLASTLDFDYEALKLATLCVHWDPKPSHILRKSRLEDTFGVRFEFKDNVLDRSLVPPMTVRSEAWTKARTLIGNNPTYQCELIYSELHNIAQRNREHGYLDEAIFAIENITSNGQVPSYAYATLSQFYAMRGNSSWLSDYLNAAQNAINALSRESPATTWYRATRDEIMNAAKQTRTVADITDMLKNANIDVS